MKVIIDKDIKHFEDIIIALEGMDKINFIYLHQDEINNKTIKDAEVLFVRSATRVDKSLLKNTQIKIVGSATAGHDHIDSKFLIKKNIEWFHAPGCNALSVINYVLSSIAYLKKAKLFNKNDNVGIVGCGNIGLGLKKALDKLSISNFSYDPYLDLDFLSDLNQIKNTSLISLHVPYTKTGKFATHNMINSKFIRDIENKILINTSRGGIVSEKEIIKNNKLRYISDVWENEPVPTKDIINYALISTPHIAGHSYNGKINGTIFLIKELQRYIKLSSEIQKNNIDTINNNFLNTKTAKTYKLDDYLETYNIKDESDNFKLTYEGSSDNEFSKTFKKRRKNHPFRRDIY